MANGFKFDNAPGAPGINIWSRGPIYPLVIARKERYVTVYEGPSGAELTPAYSRLDSISFDVLNADDDMYGFASYDDALEAAKGWLAAEKLGREDDALLAELARPVLSPFNPAAFDPSLVSVAREALFNARPEAVLRVLSAIDKVI